MILFSKWRKFKSIYIQVLRVLYNDVVGWSIELDIDAIAMINRVIKEKANLQKDSF